jgi:adenosylcobinamide kinase/adenosylcobinamide-phosphate guanylyltransferase
LNRETEKSKITLILGGARSGKSALAEKLAQVRSSAGGAVLYVATSLPTDQEMRERIARHKAGRPANWRTIEAPYDLARTVLANLQNEQVVLVDCLTIWTNNLMFRESQTQAYLPETPTFPGVIYEEVVAPRKVHAAHSTASSALEPDREEDITSELQWEVAFKPPAPPLDYGRLEAAIIAELESLVAQLRERKIGLLLVSNEVGMGLVPPYELGRAYRDLLGRVNQRLARSADEAFMVFAGLPIELKKLQADLGIMG